MHQYKELTGLTRLAMIALWAHALTKFLYGCGEAYGDNIADGSLSSSLLALIGLTALLSLFALFVSIVLVALWIYRANANAHAIGGDLTITPGWAVGWYFVPFANLVKPYEAMKETWLASHFGSNWGAGEATDLLRWWWGLWILNNILGNIAWRTSEFAPAFSGDFYFIIGAVEIPLTYILVRIMTQIRDAQKATRHAEVFA